MRKLSFLIFTVLFVFLSCGKKSGSNDNNDNNNGNTDEDNAPEVGTLQVEGGDDNPVNESLSDGKPVSLTNATMAVEFGALNTELTSALKLLACPEAGKDGPGTTAGEDCDNNGGKVAYQTPTSYKLAFKSLSIIYKEGGKDEPADIKESIVDFASLDAITETGIYEFSPDSTTISLPINTDRLTDHISKIEFELYYYEVKIKMYGEDKTIRIYMSDDDFADQGDLGHHQGDITFFDVDGIEHWARGGFDWFSAQGSTKNRGSFANGVAGTDSETGHERGMFGDAEFWNAAANVQGATKDIYSETIGLSENGTGHFYTFNFDISDSWYYEDFDTTSPNSFDPCLGGTEEGCGATWAPLTPDVSLERTNDNDATTLITLSTIKSYLAKKGELLLIPVTAESSVDSALTIKEKDLPEGSELAEQEGEGKVTRIFSWTPTAEQVSDTPYLFSYVVYNELGNGVLQAIKIKVTE